MIKPRGNALVHANHSPRPDISPMTGRFTVDAGAASPMPSDRKAHTRGTRWSAFLVALVAACGGGGGGGPSTLAAASNHSSAPLAASQTPTSGSAAAGSSGAALQLRWQSAGERPPSGADPDTYSPAIDPKTGDIWVALSFDSRYWIFSPAGKFLGTFGSPGTGNGQFDFKRPCANCGAGAIAFASDGSFFVADVGNNRIQRFDASHRYVGQWGSFGSGDGQFADANVIATDGSSVYVYDDQRTDTQVFDTTGHLLRTFAGPGGWLAIDHHGNLLVSGGDLIVKFDPTGRQLAQYQLPTFDGDRIGLAVDPLDRLLFNLQSAAELHPALGLVRFDPSTSAIETWSTGGETLAIDPAGTTVYEANFVTTGWPAPELRAYALPTP
jgi:hypothetical protein